MWLWASKNHQIYWSTDKNSATIFTNSPKTEKTQKPTKCLARLFFGDGWFNDFGGKKNIGIWICTKGTRFTTPAPQTARKFWTSVKDLTFVSGFGKGTRFLMYRGSTLQNKAQPPIKTRVIWVLGIYIYTYIYYEWLKKSVKKKVVKQN